MTAYSDVSIISNLLPTDSQFILLYESTIVSKNRIIKQEKKDEYSPPRIFKYTLKKGEDIWTIVAKTSLNIDTIATLNQIDFIGMIGEESVIYFPDTLGVFFDTNTTDKKEIAEIYSIKEKDIQLVEDPLDSQHSLFFAPEITLSFLERTYLTGVVFYAPLMGVETSKFGPRVDPFINKMTFHGGIDIAAAEGKNVHTARWGKVIYADKSNGYGNLVVIQHELGYYTLYGHLGEVAMEEGQDVESGQVIGTVGTTGRTTGPHLHFEIQRYEKKLNPDNIPFFLNHQ